MSRRHFLSLSAAGILATAASLYETGVWPGRSTSVNYWSLSSDVRDLYDASFESGLPDIRTDDLLTSLERKGILVSGEFVLSQVQARLANDPIVEYVKRPYAESELTLYVLVARLRAQSLRRFFP
ncbi:MAG: hypothetical protein ACJAYF_002108 [Arenicella sp.]|jgi:hypothetical protein